MTNSGGTEKKCPCCKVANCASELRKSRSITAFKSLENAVKPFCDPGSDADTLVQSIKACPHHGDQMRLDSWLDVTYTDAISVLRAGIAVRQVRAPWERRKVAK